ncbi:MAG: phosphatase PAP2 family protein [Thermodesulfobacteriota bacterium]
MKFWSKFSILFFSVLICCGFLFFFFPQIDIKFSAYFYDPPGGFYLKNHPVCQFIYRSVEIIAVALSVGLPVLLLISVIFKTKFTSEFRKKMVYLIMALMLGPGLLVNLIFKEHWGRARPDHIEQFGGSNRFTPAFVISRECDRNCSFVSGHASVGFYLVSAAFLLKKNRKKGLVFAVAYGFIIGLVRIVQGSHFISDVIFSFFFVFMVSNGLYFLMFHAKKPPLPDPHRRNHNFLSK